MTGLPRKLGIIPLFHGRVESIHVDVHDFPVRHPGNNSRLRRVTFAGVIDDVAIGDVSLFAALQVDRAGRAFVAVDGAAGDAGNLLVVDDGLAVQHHGDAAADERDVKRLPGVGRARLFGRGSQEPIDAAGVVAGRLGLRLGFDLHFVAAAQIDSAVGILAAVELHMQLEILELGIADNLGSVAGSHKGSILHCPFGRAGLAHLPAGEVFAVEELDGLAPLRRARLVESRRAHASPLPRFAVRAVERAGQLLAGQLSLKDQVTGAAFFFLGRNKRDAGRQRSQLWGEAARCPSGPPFAPSVGRPAAALRARRDSPSGAFKVRSQRPRNGFAVGGLRRGAMAAGR